MKYLRSAFALGGFLLLSAFGFGVSFSYNYYATGSQPQAAVFADINRDGYPDLIVGDGSKFLTILLGSSTGKFSINSNVGLAGPPRRLVTGDFDRDGYPDVAVLEDGRVEIFSSSHNGTLYEVGQITFAGNAEDMVAVDLNGDHVPDLVFTRRSTTGASYLDSYLNKTATGAYYVTFSKAYERLLSSTKYISGELVSADFNRDGYDDLAVESGLSVVILRSNKTGTFTLTQTINAPSGSLGLYDLAAGDLDVQKGPDLVMQTFDACGPDCNDHSTLLVYMNGGTGTLAYKSSLDMGFMAGGRNLLVDITGDNRLDLVHINESVWSGQLSWARSKGTGSFYPLAAVIGFEFPNEMVARDFNLDSRHDLAITDSVAPDTFAFKNTGATTICPPPKSSSLAAKICAPSTSSTGSNTFTVRGSGNSPVGVRRVELWVDGVKKYDSPDDQLRKTLTLTSGAHKLVVQAIDQFGTAAKVTKFVTVP